MKKSRTKYVTDYIKNNVKRYELKLSKKYDSLLIDKLGSVSNVNSYLKELIENDIKQK